MSDLSHVLPPGGKLDPSTLNLPHSDLFIFSTYVTTCLRLNLLNRFHQSPAGSTGRTTPRIVFMILRTVGRLFLPVSHARKLAGTLGDAVVKLGDERPPVAGVVCALWLLTDAEAAFRKRC